MIEKIKTPFYIRLLSYSEACDFVNWYNKKFDDNKSYPYANITQGGVSVQAYKEQFEKSIEYLNSKEWRYEISKEHPIKVTKNIIQNLKNKGEIE